VSSLRGSAQDLTWTAVLPADGTVPVSAVGPTFWWGGTVTDPNPQALFGQAFLEVQFYPDAIVNNCSSAGGFNVTYAPDKFSVCTPVWQVGSKSNFANGSTANKWAAASDFGGTAEVNQYCPSYGGPYCSYPWYAFNGTSAAFTYGADYPGTQFDYGRRPSSPPRRNAAARSALTPLIAIRCSARPRSHPQAGFPAGGVRKAIAVMQQRCGAAHHQHPS